MSDFETEAAKHLIYLAKCRTTDERINYLSAVMQLWESRGAMRGGQEVAEDIANQRLEQERKLQNA